MRDLSNDHRWLSINTATLRKQGDLCAIVDACARHEIRAVAPWRDQIAAVGLDRAAKAIRDAGLALSGYCRGGLFTADAAHVQAMRDDNRRALDEAHTLGAPCLVLVVGGSSRDLPGARQMVADGIGAMLPHARASGVPLAIEPLHPMYAADRACVNTTRQALDICDRLDPHNEGGLGVALDVFHIWWDFEVHAQIARAGRRILAFHVCDWLVPMRDMLNDRGMMGDGVIDIPRLRESVEAAGFDGFIEVEIFSERWWSAPIDDVLTTCIARYRSVV
ncbi:MAG: sugar phosphate isomerase/epimerase [Rhizobiales bacterium]|nr:sugar phosphate isomerase/epimerase [Hyphomicrobiales bacterium]